MEQVNRKLLILFVLIIIELAVILMLPPQGPVVDNPPNITNITEIIIPSSNLKELEACAQKFISDFKADNVIAEVSDFNSGTLLDLINEIPEDVCLSLNITKEGFGFFYHADTRFEDQCIEPLRESGSMEISETVQHEGNTYQINIKLTQVYIENKTNTTPEL